MIREGLPQVLRIRRQTSEPKTWLTRKARERLISKITRTNQLLSGLTAWRSIRRLEKSSKRQDLSSVILSSPLMVKV